MTLSAGFRSLVHTLFAGILAACVLTATPVYDTAAPYSGTRTVQGGDLVVIGNDNDNSWADGRLDWLIAPEAGLLRYTYTFTGFNSSSISHFTLDLSDNCANDAGCVTQGQVKDGTGAWQNATLEFGNKDGIVGAVKFDDGGESALVVYTFLSNRAPVYGDLFVKSGQNDLKNAGFENRVSENANWYVARPDTVFFQEDTPVPEPATSALLGAGLLLLGVSGRKFVVRG
jgi:hypothetical protein